MQIVPPLSSSLISLFLSCLLFFFPPLAVKGEYPNLLFLEIVYMLMVQQRDCVVLLTGMGMGLDWRDAPIYSNLCYGLGKDKYIFNLRTLRYMHYDAETPLSQSLNSSCPS